MQAKECLMCKYHSLSGEYSKNLICAKGHKPRFYKPKHAGFDFGWKRQCFDFEMAVNVEVLNLSL